MELIIPKNPIPELSLGATVSSSLTGLNPSLNLTAMKRGF